MMVNRNMALNLLVLAISVGTLASNARAQTSQFDFGGSDGNDLHQSGWTIFELGNSVASPQTSPADGVTGWDVTLVGPGNIGGRDRDPFAATTGGTFTLDDVYLDFIVSWEFLTVGNLDPAGIYDVQFIMFDDNNSGDGRTQTVFNITDGANDDLGTSDGPGIGGANASLLSDLDFSVVGTGLSPDASGDLAFRFANSTTGNRSLINGLVITRTNPIPEPTSVVLIGLGGLLLLGALRTRR